MKYKITIEQIETKKVLENVYISDEEIEERKSKTPKGESYPIKNYQTVEVEKEVTSQIYEQTKEKAIDLMAVIKAFNMRRLYDRPRTIQLQHRT